MVGVRTVRVYLKIIIFDCILNEKDPSAITLRFLFYGFSEIFKGSNERTIHVLCYCCNSKSIYIQRYILHLTYLEIKKQPSCHV